MVTIKFSSLSPPPLSFSLSPLFVMNPLMVRISNATNKLLKNTNKPSSIRKPQPL